MTSHRETQARLEEKLWEALDDSGFVMLGLQGVDDDFTRPMTAQIDRRDGAEKDVAGRIYFSPPIRRIWSRVLHARARRSRPSPPRTTDCSLRSTALWCSTRTAR